jgi:hypothetical protein
VNFFGAAIEAESLRSDPGRLHEKNSAGRCGLRTNRPVRLAPGTPPTSLARIRSCNSQLPTFTGMRSAERQA